VQTRLRDVFLDVLVLGLIATLLALELALAVTIISVGKPLDRVFRLLGEQREGNFQHRIRPGGLSGLGRTAARLNDHAEDLAARAAAIPDALRSTLAARFPAGRPLRLRLSNFNDIRLSLFLFALGTEIAAAFMPLYARDATRPDWISAEFAAAAPLIFYLGAIAAISPFGSMLIRLVGARRLFLVSAPGAGVALVGLGLSTSVISITIWQGVMAAFYATASIAGQEYAIRAAGEKDRAKAVGAFVAVVYGGLFVGSALGGLLAGRFGFEVAFFTGAALAVISVILGASSMRGRAGDRVEGRADGASDPAAVRVSPRSWLTGRYLALLLGVAVPMNATMVIYVWYLAPLMLSDSGSGPAEIARVLLLYYLAIVLLGPTVARLADGRPGPAILLTTGAAISGASLLSLTVWGGFWAIACALAGVGIGQVLMQTPIYALALRLTGGLGRGIDALRLIERLGAIAGLAISAALLGAIGAEESLRYLGLAVLAGIVVFVIVSATGRQRSA
jgi:MFS family permease